MNRYTCSDCGNSFISAGLEDNTVSCPRCRGRSIMRSWELPGDSDKPTAGEDSSDISNKARKISFQFTGTAAEYFKIWIVNAFLTIITLGIYAAWAKVRNRQYFYKNTMLDGHSFGYTADPKAILKGHLIIGVGFCLYWLTRKYDPRLSIILTGIFSLIFPFFIYKSLKFFTYNSTYRNIRFRFLGTIKESYSTYLLLPILIPLTLGIMAPYWAFRQKKYFYSNFAYGATGNRFEGKAKPFYQEYLVMALLFIVLLIISGFIIGLLLYPGKGAGPEKIKIMKVFMPIIMVIVAVTLSVIISQMLYAWTTNYCLRNSRLGPICFQSNIKESDLVWIAFSNILLTIFSVGLLAPWAKVRRIRYLCENIDITTEHDLNEFSAAVEPEQSPYGDAATDFLGFDVGI